jgi:2-hydroxychromene-2-carboxylate isomerase
MANPIDFYFDFSSPYGYFASAKIEDIASRHGRTVNWRPILLGAVFKVTGSKPLAAIPLKSDYMKRDLERTARLLNVPFRLPSNFPIGTMAPARAFYYVNNQDPAAAKRLALAFYVAYFADNIDISSPEATVDIAGHAGLDRDEITRALDDQTVKDRLRRETDAAISLGVFGSPYIVVDGEPFWGSDRLEQVEKWLENGGW